MNAKATAETSNFEISEMIDYNIHRPLLCCQKREEDLAG